MGFQRRTFLHSPLSRRLLRRRRRTHITVSPGHREDLLAEPSAASSRRRRNGDGVRSLRRSSGGDFVANSRDSYCGASSIPAAEHLVDHDASHETRFPPSRQRSQCRRLDCRHPFGGQSRKAEPATVEQIFPRHPRCHVARYPSVASAEFVSPSSQQQSSSCQRCQAQL